MSIKIFIISLLAILPLAKPASKYYDGPIRPYEFGFNIEGNQHRKESKDKNGIIMGEFGFITADNVYHVTVYATDENGNFKIVSMKNYKLGPRSPPPPPQQIATTPTTTTTSTTPQPFRIMTTAKSALDPSKPNGFNACSGCKIPDSSSTTSKPAKSEASSGDSDSTPAPPPFKIVNKNEIESVNNNNSPASSTSSQGKPPSSESIDVQEVPQKLVKQDPKDQSGGSRESTSPSKPKTPEGSQLPTAASQSESGGRNPSSDQKSKDKPFKSNSSSSGGSDQGSSNNEVGPAKLDGVNMANTMIQHILNGLLYRFNYTVGYHGHHEQGDRKGNKEGGYFSIGRDGIRRGVTYKANEFGFQPQIKFEKVSPEETPREETEKQAGLKGFDFKWFWGGSS
ncbi:protein lethal(3)malignant blood neoplasm 1 [Uranotaenia lowii]|uniref:protein lethal(3)malignant blood neoplasm 1 n=1 Tax=Uranotaenia lowii TaxID=190385 RepID=UPI00247A8879|nr:protein lethal(3)malignant blood neoplasm 1 [Uranotaenia lowii]